MDIEEIRRRVIDDLGDFPEVTTLQVSWWILDVYANALGLSAVDLLVEEIEDFLS